MKGLNVRLETISRVQSKTCKKEPNLRYAGNVTFRRVWKFWHSQRGRMNGRMLDVRTRQHSRLGSDMISKQAFVFPIPT